MSRSYRSGVIALSLAALVAAGCSSSSPKSTTGSGTTVGGATATTLSSVPIKIGVLLPESGPSAANGAGHKPLLDNILKEPNHASIDGHPVQIVIVDDTGTSAGGAAGARQLIDQDHVSVIIGSNLTAVATAELPVSTASKVLEITLTGCPQCGDGKTYPYNFTIEWDRPSQGPATIGRVKSLGKSSFAILQSLDPSGQAYVDALTAAASAGGVTISKKVTFQPSTLDLSNQVAQLKSAGADLVYVAAVSPADIANVVKAMDEAQYHPKLLGNSALSVVTVSDAVPAASKSWVQSSWQASGFGVHMVQGNLSPQVQAWHDLLVKLIGPQENTISLNNVTPIQDAFDLFKAAVEATHSTDGPTLATWIETNGFQGLRAKYTFTPDRHNGLTSDTVGWAIPGTLKDGWLAQAPST